MSDHVLDASAILAFIAREPGGEVVEGVLDCSYVSSINLAEVFSKLVRKNMDVAKTRLLLAHCCPRVVAVDRAQSEAAALIHAANRKLELSYADSFCLALGTERRLPILTADRKWEHAELDVPVDLSLIR